MPASMTALLWLATVVQWATWPARSANGQVAPSTVELRTVPLGTGLVPTVLQA